MAGLEMAFLTGTKRECEIGIQSSLERYLLVNRYYILGDVLGEWNANLRNSD